MELIVLFKKYNTLSTNSCKQLLQILIDFQIGLSPTTKIVNYVINTVIIVYAGSALGLTVVANKEITRI